MDELSVRLTNSRIGCHINDTCVNHIIYADDSVLLSPSPAGLQKLLDICNIYAENHDITYNIKKSICMCLKPSNVKRMHVPTMNLNGKPLKLVQSYKYLGVIINENFTDDKDVERQLRCLYARGNSLIRNLKNCSNDVKALLFKTYCTVLYCSSLWCYFKVSTMSKLRVAYKQTFKYLFGINFKESITANMLIAKCNPMEVILRKSADGLRNRLMSAENGLVRAITLSDFIHTSGISRQWNKMIFK